MSDTTISFEDFKAQWLQEITANNPTTIELGNRFSSKLVTDWLDIAASNDNIFYCDGSGDGGIDIAYLSQNDAENDGHIWYLVQSKYGSAFAGRSTLLNEALKVIDTLNGHSKRLSSMALELIERLQYFRKNASQEKDKLVLLFATNDPITDEQKRVLDDIRLIGKERLGDFFDTEAISIHTIYQRVIDNPTETPKHELPFVANLVPSGEDLLVGSIKLTSLYQFLETYKTKTKDLDLIYEKNVRKFLGSGKAVNRGIAETLKSAPERFGLYNNGITIVVEHFSEIEKGKFTLVAPYIVNGCQTTKTIWETLDKRLNSGGTGIDPEREEWKRKLEKGIVVVKVVKVGAHGEELLKDTTRFTNSQNTVSKKDFIALEQDFKRLARELKDKHDIYLEIQRGGIDSQKAKEKKSGPFAKRFSGYTNAFDLLKVYGAGWLNEPGTAFGKNAPFAPGGTIFKRIFEDLEFTVNDLYASYLLQRLTNEKFKFGRDTVNQETRGKTRFLFYYVLIELLRDCMIHTKVDRSEANISTSVINVFEDMDSEAAKRLAVSAQMVIDDYMTKGKEDSVFEEEKYNNDMNNFMKWDKLGKGKEFTARLETQISFAKRDMKRSSDNGKSTIEIVGELISHIRHPYKDATNNMPPVGHVNPTSQNNDTTTASNEFYRLENQRKRVAARGVKLSEDGLFKVLAGSTISREAVPSLPLGIREERENCKRNQIVVNDTFRQDYTFSSWSAAACFVLGRSASGPKFWIPERE